MDKLTSAKVFVAIIQEGSLASAAEALGMSRSMVTRHLAEFEDWAAVRLLNRSTRRLSLTSDGERVYSQCLKLLDVAQTITEHSTDGKEPHGLLRIGCSNILGQFVLPEIIQRFQSKYPEVSIELVSRDDIVNLVEEQIDLCIKICNKIEPNTIATKLGECRTITCASPSYLEAHGEPTELKALANHNVLQYMNIEGSMLSFYQPSDDRSTPVTGNFSTNNACVMTQMLRHGSGISIVPSFSAEPLIKTGELQAILKDYPTKPLGIYGMYASQQYQSPTLLSFMEFLTVELERAAARQA